VPPCCDDERALFLWQPDGAPLDAYFFDIVDVTLESGHGQDGNDALHSDHSTVDGAVAQIGYAPSQLYSTPSGAYAISQLDECGNPRRAFGIGIVGNFANDYWETDLDLSEWKLFELRTGADPTTNQPSTTSGRLLSVWVRGRDIYVSPSSPTLSGADDALAYYTNVLRRDGTFQRVEIRGSINSVSGDAGSYVPSADGWLELRVDGRVYQNGDDADALPPLDPENPPVVCPAPQIAQFINESQINQSATDFGWGSAHFGPMGDIHCLYVKEEAAYCNLRPAFDPRTSGTTRQDCDPPGPGGSTFGGTAQGPRIAHPGGYRATYQAPTMGGAPATASDPTDAQTMTNATVPLFSLDFTLPDATTVRWAQAPLVRSGSKIADDRVLGWTAPASTLATRFGAIKAQTWSVTVDDSDYLVRGWLNSAANRFLLNREVTFYTEDNAARLAGTARRSVTRGRITNVRLNDDELTASFDLSDDLTRPFSPHSLDRLLPPAKLGEIYKATSTATGIQFSDDCPEETAETAAPIVIGPYSDEDRLLRGKTPSGIVPLQYVGTVRLASGSQAWHAYAVCLYAAKGMANSESALFGSNEATECPGSVRLDPDLMDGSFLVPDQGNWDDYFSTPYIDVTVDGVTYRMTMIFGRGPISDAHVEGEVPLSCNLWGVENVGDGSGTMITHAADVIQWVLDQPILQAKTSGTWGSVATFSGGTAKIRTSSFNAVRTLHGERLTGNYPIAMILDRQRPARDWLAELMVGSDIRLGITNHHGQITAFTLDDSPTLSSLVTFTDLVHIDAGSFKVSPDVNAELENWLTFNYGPELATGRTAGTPDKVNDSASISGFGETRKADELLFVTTRSQAMARDVASRRVMATREGIRRGTFAIDTAGYDLTLGQLIRVTHFAGIGTTGWTNRILLVTGISPNPMPESGFPVTVSWEDVHEQLVVNDGAAPGSETASTGHLMALASNSSASLMGSLSAGTARRMG
jgi:hypothetical protein